MFENTLTTGAGGMIGNYVDFGVRMNHSSLDITDLSEVRAVCGEHKPQTIIHLAAATDLARCEREPAYAYRVNSVGTYNIALVAREIGAKLVYVSTSGIFDGTKETPYTVDDVPNPLSHYGHSKYLGELAVQGILSDYLIVRTSWVFGGGSDKDRKFVGKVMQLLDQSEIQAVADKRGSPSYGKDVITGIKYLLKEGKNGIYHLGNAGSATRAEIMREIVATTGSGARVVEVDSSTFAAPYASGANESMVSEPFMRPWQEALREYLETEWGDVVASRSK